MERQPESAPARRRLHTFPIDNDNGSTQESYTARSAYASVTATAGNIALAWRRRPRINKTTYCWRIPAAPMIKQPKWTDDVLSGEAKGCPISMEINLASTEVTAGEFVSVNWTVKLEKERLVNSSNTMRQGSPLARILDEASGTLVDVIHSNVHSCEFGSNCDPFRMGNRFVDNTPNKVANFSQDGTILFTSQQELLFPAAGIFSVLAHIIIPGANATSERYDYAVYQRLTVKDAVAPTPAPVAEAIVATGNNSPSGVDANIASADESSSSDDSKLSSGVIIAIVLGALAVVVLVLIIVFVVHKRRTKQGGARLATPVLSPLVGHQPRPLAPFEKATFNDGYSEASSHNIAILGRQRLGAKPRAGAGAVGPAATSYLTSADPHHVIVRGKEMDIRDFDNTADDDNTTSYPFVPPQAYNNNVNYARPQDIVDSTFSVDFAYPDTNQDEELLHQMRRQRSDDFAQSGLDTNDSYLHYIDSEDMSNANSRVFSEDSDSSEKSETVDSERFDGRFSDVTDPREDVEL